MYIGLNIKYPLFLSDFNEAGIYEKYFLNILRYQIHKNLCSGGQVFHADRCTDG